MVTVHGPAAEPHGFEPSEPASLRILGADERELLAIHGDGTVTGDVADAGEAAALFVDEVRRLWDTGAEGAVQRVRELCAPSDSLMPQTARDGRLVRVGDVLAALDGAEGES